MVYAFEKECKYCGSPIGEGVRQTTEQRFNEAKGCEYTCCQNLNEDELPEHVLEAQVLGILRVKVQLGHCSSCCSSGGY